MTGTITTTVTFHDLIHQYDDELDDLRDGYDDVVAKAEADHGEGALEDLSTDANDDLQTLKQTAVLYNESGKEVQKRQHALEQIKERFDGNRFKIKMLSGEELMDIETTLKMRANNQDTDPELLQSDRHGMVVDAATVEAPEDVPTDDNGSPLPSKCPNTLTFALYEQVERVNQAGDTDFRAPGFGDGDVSDPSVSSATPTRSDPLSSESVPTDASTPDTGDSS